MLIMDYHSVCTALLLFLRVAERDRATDREREGAEVRDGEKETERVRERGGRSERLE